MPTTLTNGIQLPDKGSVDWYNSMQSNYNLIDTHLGNTDTHVTAEDKANWNSKQGSLSQAQLDAIAQVATNTNDIATLQSGKADASHTHSSSDITDIGDYATKQYVDNSISGLVDSAPNALDTLNELAAALNDDANFASTVTTALSAKANSADLATVATSGSYNDLSNKPTINDSTITIQKNGSTIDTFTTNGSAKTINIPVPTKTSDLTNDSNFVDTSNAAVSSGITSAKVTDYDTHIADTDIHVTTADKNKWNNNTYVFRYSSTALVASSTNSNTLLDNTDNLKVGDKVIDSNGVLFSITAIDTQNSTFTIGTALIDLAQDSDVVHKSGDETVSGTKTFSDLQIIGYGTQYKGARNAYILPEFAAGYSGLSITTLSFAQTVKIGNFILDANNKPSLDQTKAYIQIATGESNGVNSCVLEPRNSTSSLGTSSNKWSKICGTEYYYGANNVEFSTKFVTTDTAQTISGAKVWTDTNTFQQNITYARTNFYHQAVSPCYILKDTELEKGSLASTHTAYPGLWQDKNGSILGYVRFVEYSSGRQTAEFKVSNLIKNGALDPTGSEVNCTVLLELQPSGEKSLIPEQNNDINLGTATNKWKGINGLEPSSLSLPSDRNARIDISSYITNLGNGNNNQYIVPANGYIWLHFTSINSALCYSQTSGGLTNYAQPFARFSGDGQLYAFFPVRKDDYFIVQIYTSSTAVVQNAYFIPCQGNV